MLKNKKVEIKSISKIKEVIKNKENETIFKKVKNFGNFQNNQKKDLRDQLIRQIEEKKKNYIKIK